jgi:methylmalonyl-CoA/ethylmalonyl-CoA epimerase
MTSIRQVDHVAIAVHSIEQAIRLFGEALGGEFVSGGDNDETGIRLVYLRLPGLKLELMQPLRRDSFLQRHLDERGPGFHHLTLFVDDLPATVTDLSTAGFKMADAHLSSPAWKEAFMRPPSAFGTLLQFVETTLRWDEPARHITIEDVLAGRVVWREYRPCLRDHPGATLDGIHPTEELVHFVDTESADTSISPLPLLRSRRQSEILAVVLEDPTVEFPLSALAQRLDIPYSSVHREVERAVRFGVVTTRRFENLRLVRANTASPYYESLARLLRNR